MRRPQARQTRRLELVERSHEQRRAIRARVNNACAVGCDRQVPIPEVEGKSAAVLGGVMVSCDTRGRGRIGRVASQTAMPARMAATSATVANAAMRPDRDVGGTIGDDAPTAVSAGCAVSAVSPLVDFDARVGDSSGGVAWDLSPNIAARADGRWPGSFRERLPVWLASEDRGNGVRDRLARETPRGP